MWTWCELGEGKKKKKGGNGKKDEGKSKFYWLLFSFFIIFFSEMKSLDLVINLSNFEKRIGFPGRLFFLNFFFFFLFFLTWGWLEIWEPK